MQTKQTNNKPKPRQQLSKRYILSYDEPDLVIADQVKPIKPEPAYRLA